MRIQRLWDRHRVVVGLAAHFRVLAHDVALVADIGHHAVDERGRDRAEHGLDARREPRELDIRPLREIKQPRAAFAHLGKRADELVLRAHARLERGELRGIDDAPLRAEPREPLVGVVHAQEQPVLRARREHAVGLARRARDEVVEHHARVRLAAREPHGIEPARAASGVQAREQSLRARLLVAARAVDLPGEEEPRDALGFRRRVDLVRPDHVVLDGVSELLDLGALEAA